MTNATVFLVFALVCCNLLVVENAESNFTISFIDQSNSSEASIGKVTPTPTTAESSDSFVSASIIDQSEPSEAPIDLYSLLTTTTHWRSYTDTTNSSGSFVTDFIVPKGRPTKAAKAKAKTTTAEPSGFFTCMLNGAKAVQTTASAFVKDAPKCAGIAVSAISSLITACQDLLLITKAIIDACTGASATKWTCAKVVTLKAFSLIKNVLNAINLVKITPGKMTQCVSDAIGNLTAGLSGAYKTVLSCKPSSILPSLPSLPTLPSWIG